HGDDRYRRTGSPGQVAAARTAPAAAPAPVPKLHPSVPAARLHPRAGAPEAARLDSAARAVKVVALPRGRSDPSEVLVPQLLRGQHDQTTNDPPTWPTPDPAGGTRGPDRAQRERDRELRERQPGLLPDRPPLRSVRRNPADRRPRR